MNPITMDSLPVESGRRGEPRCSFCGKSQGSVAKVIAGPGVFICDECVELCEEIIAEEKEREQQTVPSYPSIVQIAEGLRKVAAGEHLTTAIFRLSWAVHRHCQQLHQDDIKILPHVMLKGPTGSGKTLLARGLQRTVNLAVGYVDMSRITITGYAGRDPCSVLLDLIAAADYDVRRAQRGILVMDNFDRVMMHGDQRFLLQQEFLEMLEGGEVVVNPDARRGQNQITLDTRKVMFIACGRFDPMEASNKEQADCRLVPPLLARFPLQLELPSPSAANLEEMLPSQLTWNEFPRKVQNLLPELKTHIARLAAAQGVGAWGLQRVLTAIECALEQDQRSMVDAAYVDRVAKDFSLAP